jgi:hypothetical protein
MEVKAMTKEEKIAKLEKLGFRRWTKAGYDRLYVGAEKLGLEVERYKSGNVCWAAWKGEQISNSKAGRMLADKTYIDVTTWTLHSTSDILAEEAQKLMATVA